MAFDSPVRKAWESSQTAVPFSTISGAKKAKKYRFESFVFLH